MGRDDFRLFGENRAVNAIMIGCMIVVAIVVAAIAQETGVFCIADLT